MTAAELRTRFPLGSPVRALPVRPHNRSPDQRRAAGQTGRVAVVVSDGVYVQFPGVRHRVLYTRGAGLEPVGESGVGP